MTILAALIALLTQAGAPAAANPPSAAPQPAASATPQTSTQLLDAVAPGGWVAIPDDDLLVMTLAGGKKVVIQLAPSFAPAHVANIRAIARAKWWDGETIYRVQDNYVTQWGDATEKKPLPAGIKRPPAEYTVPAAAHPMVMNPFRDAYAARTGYSHDGWPVASDGTSAWLPHCYGMVGVARDLAPDTGAGGDLYTVIGHAPRHLDRNIAVVGRILEGMGHMSALPRGTGGGLGLYEDKASYVPIVSVRLASDLPAGERPRFEYLKPTVPQFAPLMQLRANPQPPFFTVPAGAFDLCNMRVPVRPIKPR